MNQNQPDRHGTGVKRDKEPGGNTRNQERRPGRGSQHGSGDQAELQDQEEFDRGDLKSPSPTAE
jgi:hypothetical protein